MLASVAAPLPDPGPVPQLVPRHIHAEASVSPGAGWQVQVLVFGKNGQPEGLGHVIPTWAAVHAPPRSSGLGQIGVPAPLSGGFMPQLTPMQLHRSAPSPLSPQVHGCVNCPQVSSRVPGHTIPAYPAHPAKRPTVDGLGHVRGPASWGARLSDRAS